MVKALGAPADFTDHPEKYLPQARIIRPVYPQQAGFVSAMHTRDIGLSIIELKGGRTSPEQKLDYATGYTGFCQLGDYVDDQQPLAVIHAQSEDDYQRAADSLRRFITVCPGKPKLSDPVIDKVE